MYYLNVWQSSLNNGTSLLYKTEDKEEFKSVLKEMMTMYPPVKGVYKVTKYKDNTFVSFADIITVYTMWLLEVPKGKTDYCELVRIDKLFDVL